MTEARFQRLSAELDRLFELSPSARAERLAAIRADDTSLADDLERLIAADERSGVLDAGVVRASPTLMAQLAAEPDAAAGAAAGKHIGHYRLIERIGSGGMGEVWRGERSDGEFEQQVAIKLIRPLIDSPHLRERFARERRILARLDHANIARLLDGGVSDDGTPWYAMEFVRGIDIVSHCERQALDVRARVELLLQVCDAVAHAQSLLVVHRDLKPSNILVDAEGRARVLDFGIARLLDESIDVQLTGTGVRMFSPAYAAPEQIRGGAVGTATDVYGLGAVLYELLTGAAPHPRRSSAPDRLLAGLEQESAPRPGDLLRERSASISDPGSARRTRGLTADLDTVVATALQPDAARRYSGAAQLGDDLRRWLDGRPIAAQPDTAGYRMRKFVARHRIAVGSASAVLLALIAGLGLALWQASVAREQAQRAQEQTRRALRVKEFLVSLFAESEGMARPKNTPRTPLAMIEDGIASASRDLVDDRSLQDSVLGDLLDIKVNLGAGAASLEPLDRLIEYRRTQFGSSDPRVAEALATKINALFQLGRFPDAEPLIDEAIAIHTRAYGADHLEVTNMQNRMVRVRVAQTRMDDALALMREVVRKTEAGLGAAHPELGMRLGNLATVLLRQQQFVEARAALERSLAILEAARGPNHPMLAFPLNTLGDLQRDAHELSAALTTYRRSAGILRIAMGAEHPRYAVALNRIGDVQRRLRDFPAAAGSLEQARVIQEQGSYAEVGDTYARLGDLAIDRNQPALAETWYRKAHQAQLSTQGERSKLTWTRLGQLFNALVDQGRYDEARTLRDQITEGLRALGKGSETDVALSRFIAGLLERNAGNLDRAVELTTSAHAELSTLIPATDRRHLPLRIQLALTLALRGSAPDRAMVESLAAQIEAPASDYEPTTRASYLLLQAVRAPPGDLRDRHLGELDAMLSTIGSDGNWLRDQHARLQSRGRE
jgi:eukaryotic-like serine/threonine-protein kinase